MRQIERVEETDKHLAGINQVRRLCKLPKIVRGKKTCLRCGKDFMSDNVRTNRMCTSCRNVRD